MNEADIEIKKEEVTEEDPLSNVYHTTATKELYDTSGPVIKKEVVHTEQLAVKEELEDEVCDLKTKIEIVDDMLPFIRDETSHLQDFL